MNKKHSVTINRHRTSVTIEDIFWDCLKNISAEKKESISSIIASVDTLNPENLSSAIRIFVLEYYKNKFGF